MAKIDENLVANNLCASALEFINASIDDIDNKPKFGIVNFAIGVELLLKARLVHEHWSVIVTSNPNSESFIHGKFQSITINEALKRLSNIADDDIGSDARQAFSAIAEHRNRLVHFVADAQGPLNDKFQREVAKEVYVGWYHLVTLLKRWKNYFKASKSDITQINNKIRSVREFLKVIFNTKKTQLESYRESGVPIFKCPRCTFKAMPLKQLTENIAAGVCAVCELRSNWLRFQCPADCGMQYNISQYDGFHFSECECGYSLDQGEVFDLIDTGFSSEYYQTQITCGECESDGTVANNDDRFVCIECIYVAEDVQECEWCSSVYIGGPNLEDSFLSGCNQCDGRIGWDDD